MQLAMNVFAIVLGATIVMAILGILIDRSAARDERNEDR